MNKITVLMPSYNRGRYITEAVNSVLNQKTKFGVKLIITDDCSTDGSVEKIKDFHKTHPDNIEIILSGKNERLLSNILKAQMRVETEYFCVLDPDDYYTDEFFLQKAVDFLDTHKEFTIYSSNCMMLYDDGSHEPYIKTQVQDSVFSFNDLLQDKVIITQTAGSIFRNVVYNNGIPEIIKNAIGTYSESSFRADTERYIFHLHKGKAYFKNEFAAVYRMHQDGIWTNTNKFHHNLLHAQAFYDYFRYFEYKYPEYFIKVSNSYAKQCFEYLKISIDSNSFTQTADIGDMNQLFALLSETEKYKYKVNKKNVEYKFTVKKLIKYLLPYGLVRFLQSRR